MSEPGTAEPRTDNPESRALKDEVRGFWNRQSCDTWEATSEQYSRAYFEEIEAYRYYDQPFIHSFAQFTRYCGRRVLEVGFGAGTDFIQWLRAGAVASGIDLTNEALRNVRSRIQVYGLPEPESLEVADAERLPFEDASFDLGYSFGVLHHTPDTEKAIAELVRVIRPGGELKIMLYNRRSIWAFNQWLKHALCKGRPWRSLGWVVWHHIESTGTKAYTRKEVVDMLAKLPLSHVQIRTEITSADYLAASGIAPLNWCYRLLIRVAGWRFPWRVEQIASQAAVKGRERQPLQHPDELQFSGNRLGFFHCIRARKREQT